jgi:RHS repeat-associated protein
MGVTSYYSFGGEIIGEETAGVRRDYLTDALGSVTATVTGAGVVENTYRYKPYGETLAKTGTGSDPKFLWTGKWGYKKSQDYYYVRNRNYYYVSGTWTTKDLISSKIFHNKYLYCLNNPILLLDPDGLKPISFGPVPPDASLACGISYSAKTGCDISSGSTWIIICDFDSSGGEPGKCNERQKCALIHEQVHQKQLSPCCTLASICKKIPSNRYSNDCENALKDWATYNDADNECNAYRAAQNCFYDLVGKPHDPDCDPWKFYCPLVKRQSNCCSQAKPFLPCPFDAQGRIVNKNIPKPKPGEEKCDEK